MRDQGGYKREGRGNGIYKKLFNICVGIVMLGVSGWVANIQGMLNEVKQEQKTSNKISTDVEVIKNEIGHIKEKLEQSEVERRKMNDKLDEILKGVNKK